MSSVLPTLESRTPDTSPNTPPPSSRGSKPQRVLACVLCQQRKVRCDRVFPCQNCLKSRARCVPATLAPRRPKRKSPQRALLERLRKYESLLRQNNISFEPFFKNSAAEKESLNVESGDESDDDPGETARPDKSTGHEVKNIWHVMSQAFREPGNDSDSSYDDVRETVVKTAYEHSLTLDHSPLFGFSRTAIDLSTLHPDPVQIFKIWQIYLDNVNPLLKITHTPSLQGRIIEATSNITDIDPNLEALMFSIYCMSVLSITVEDCSTTFDSSKEDLLMRYQFGCQQALLNCRFLQSSDRDCLTALFFYLISVRPSTVPQSLSSLLGIAMRIAKRMGIHSESELANCGVVEAEMRRRLWWSLILFDYRLSEISSSKPSMLDPTWDCKVALNVNDSDLRVEMKVPPAVQGISSDALFAVVRSELGDLLRHTGFHLDFTNPVLKPLVKNLNTSISGGDELKKLEEKLESQYLKFCDQENPIHFMAIWTTRAHLAKCRLLEHQTRFSDESVRQTETQHDAATSHALRMLECDTMVMASPLTKGFLWLNHFYFPFPGYMQVIQDLRRRPLSQQARKAWEVMSDNYLAWIDVRFRENNPFFRMFSKMVFGAWDACEAAFKQSGQSFTVPRIVSVIRKILAEAAHDAGNLYTEHPNFSVDTGGDELPMSIDLADQSFMGMQQGTSVMDSQFYSGISAPASLAADMNQFDWTTLGGKLDLGEC